MNRICILLACWLSCAVEAATPSALVNQLAEHPSPYLAMHQQDAVHWQLWNRETLRKARELNRPILVSIGYFSCHWCHVMQRESYQDPQLARLLNEAFIPVKIDRELEPALDAHLIEFVELTRGQAGWPLNVFLTPEGYPFLGVVYLPRDRFHALLTELRQRWDTDAAQLQTLAQQAIQEWRQVRGAESRQASSALSFAQQFNAQAQRMQDELAGGFGQQSKFPMVPQLRALLWLRSHREQTDFDEFLRLTLDRMADQGLHDLLGGGFFRYVTDPGWQVPHYEKMLYDNAQLALLYFEAAEQFRSTRYRDIALSTLDFMVREMRAGDGYFISSFSAVDDKGREGFYYLWDEEALEALLDAPELQAVNLVWFDAGVAETEYGKLPRVQMSRVDAAAKLKWTPERLDNVLSSARGKLLAARAQRTLPADNKGLAAWNGLALSALAAGYAVKPGSGYAGPAAQLVSWLTKRLWDGKRLARALDGDARLAEGSLEDYALVAQGLWDWEKQQAQSERAAVVEAMLRTGWDRFFIEGRWLQSDAPLIPMLEGRIALEDGPLPSASAVIAQLTSRHASLKKDKGLQDQLGAHLAQVNAHLGGSAFWYASYMPLLGESQSLR
ncbi:MAG: thioredoxin domain-containing protein [Thiogranum sp.]|nr:thioredoxin domain-containing protein [Thiogranum sp.]